MIELSIKNFGVINQTFFNFSSMTFLIGKSATGKSTAAKLLAAITTFMTNQKDWSIKSFYKHLKIYDVASLLKEDSYFKWKSDNAILIYEKNTVQISGKAENFRSVIYIPAERLALSMFSKISPTILHQYFNFGTPNYRELFIANCIVSEEYNILPDFVGCEFLYDEKKATFITDKKTYSIPFHSCSSSQRYLIEMIKILQYYSSYHTNSLIIIEEPEMNLFPSTQIELLQYIIAMTLYNQKNNQVVIMTNSPYVLTSCNNSIQAGIITKNPKKESAVSNIMPKKFWLAPEKVNAYLLKKDEAEDIMDRKDTQLILAEYIDNASEEINNQYNNLLEIKGN